MSPGSLPGEPWILLVEDTPEDRELAVHALRRGDVRARIEEAKDGVEAIDRLYCRGAWAHRDPEDLPRAVLLDIKMPRVDGVEVLRELKSSPRLSQVPVVMLTSSAEDTDLSTCYALGANSYIVKPVEIETFFQTMLDLGRYWLIINRSPQEKRYGVALTTVDR